MARSTITRRHFLQQVCTSCGGPNDRLPLQLCSKCAAKDNQRTRAYYRNNRKKVLKRTRAYYLEHQEEYAKWRADWYAKHPDANGKYTRQAKIRALQIVAGRPDPICVYCGCNDIRFLEINHKKGGGAKETQTAGNNFYWDIIKGRRPIDDLEIACGLDNKLHFYKLKYGDDADRFLVLWAAYTRPE